MSERQQNTHDLRIQEKNCICHGWVRSRDKGLVTVTQNQSMAENERKT